jgi:putative transposase
VLQACKRLGYARSSYYKARKVRSINIEKEQKIVDWVVKKRHVMPKIGGKKLHHIFIKKEIVESMATVGRDKLFTLLKKYELQVVRKRKYVTTTNSNHPFKKYTNLLKGTDIIAKDKVWVSDITYVRTKQGFKYASLITDLYSRKIVGYNASDSLELEGCVRALQMALKHGRPKIHHSDRGCQYCSHIYTNLLKNKGVKISMTQDGNCYDNAVAERVNGILKGEFSFDKIFNNTNHVRKALKQAVKTYNFDKPHWAINLKVPADLYEAA